MKTLDATPKRPGPDDNAARPYRGVTTFELRDVQSVGRPYRYLEGMAVPYDVWADVGWFLEQHAGGSFRKSTKAGSGKAAPLLLHHDRGAWPAGHAEEWRHGEDGMHGVWRLNDTPAAQQAAQLAEAGDLVGLSVGFQPINSHWDFADDWDPDLGPDHMDKVTRTESRLLEVSLTPTPAFGEAGVTQVRTYTREARSRFVGGDHQLATYWRGEVDRLRARA